MGNLSYLYFIRLTTKTLWCIGNQINKMANLTNNTTSNFDLNDVQFKEYLTKEWLSHKDYWSTGSTPEELVNYTQPTEGDLECLVEYLINDLRGDEHTQMFHKLVNQANKLFGYSK